MSFASVSMTAICQASPVQIDVACHINDPLGPYPFPRSPVLLPTAYIDDYTLSFENLWGSYVLQLVQDGETVYTTVIPAGTVSVVLPSTLTGDYEFRLVADSYYYYGNISL